MQLPGPRPDLLTLNLWGWEPASVTSFPSDSSEVTDRKILVSSLPVFVLMERRWLAGWTGTC